MRSLFSAFGRMFFSYRRKLLHLLFLASLAGLVAGWSLFDLLGPISIMLPAVAAIGAGLSEVEQFHWARRSW